MPAESNSKQIMSKSSGFRPPKNVLDVFWTLSDGNDEQRSAGALKLTRLIENLQGEDKENVLTYSKERLVKGLSSGRKFARVGFSLALTQLLRQYKELETSELLSTIKAKLKIVRHEKKSKAEVGGIYLGRAFAYSAIIQAGRTSQLSGEDLSNLVEELVTLSEKKSYLKAVCNKILEDITSQVSTDVFAEHIWPKIREKIKEGWGSCTLDRVSLLLACRDKFPDVVNKKFLRKHWGFPLFSEENDDKLMKATLDTVQKTEIFMEKILPKMLEGDRDVMSVWKGVGEKLMNQLPEKKMDTMIQRQIMGLKIASKLLSHVESIEQLLDLVLCPGLAKSLFHSITKKQDPLAMAADSLCEQLRERLKTDSASVEGVIKRLWKLEAAMAEQENVGRVDLVGSNNFTRLVDMLSKSEAEKFVHVLINCVMGQDKWQVISSNPKRQRKQVEWCLRQIHHICCSQQLTSLATQCTSLSLFLRLSFFHVNKKTKSIQHCESCVNFESENSVRKMCETFLYKGLDNLATPNTSQQKKSEHLSSYLNLLQHLADYVQDLLKAETVTPIKEWPDQMAEAWQQLLNFATKLKKKADNEVQTSAFLLLSLFLGFHMMTDYQTAAELLQDVYVCYDKAVKGKKSKGGQSQSDADPEWVEVVTEILLNLMSLQSHLSRVITATVFRSLSSHVNLAAVALITEVITPKKTRGDDAGGVLVEAENDEEGGDEDDDADDDLEEDESSVESGDDDDDEEEEMDEDDDDDNEDKVDDKFRESVKQALGNAADDDSEGEEELPDLSDSEMFKLDDMLAEVFRQRKKTGGKKAREEKKKEMANFRVRVLDLVEILIKGERCGDFLLDLIKPLLLLTMRTSATDSQALTDRARSLFNLLKSKAKGLTDSVHTSQEQTDLFKELIGVAQSVTDSSHLQDVAVASHIVMNVNCGDNNANDKSKKSKKSSSTSECEKQVLEILQKVIAKKQSKPHLSYFLTLIELDPIRFQALGPVLLESLKDKSTKTHSRMICCSLLASLCKKTDNVKDSDLVTVKTWMTELAEVVKQMVLDITTDDMKVMLCKDILTLALTLQGRKDVLAQAVFGADVKQHLLEVKSKFHTDLRRLANKLIASIDKVLAANGKTKSKKKKRKADDTDLGETPAKRQKTK